MRAMLGYMPVVCLAGVWLTEDLLENLVEMTREAFSMVPYESFDDEEIEVALDFAGLEPETAAQFLEDWGDKYENAD